MERLYRLEGSGLTVGKTWHPMGAEVFLDEGLAALHPRICVPVTDAPPAGPEAEAPSGPGPDPVPAGAETAPERGGDAPAETMTGTFVPDPPPAERPRPKSTRRKAK